MLQSKLASTFAPYADVALADMHLYTGPGQVAEQLRTPGTAPSRQVRTCLS